MTSTISKRLEKIQDIVDNLKDAENQIKEIEAKRYKALCHGLRMLGYDEETIQHDAPILIKQAEKERALKFANIEAMANKL